jgi:beta-glucosidase
MNNPAITGDASASLEPYYSIRLFDAIKEKLGRGVEISYAVGAYARKMLPLIDQQMTNAAIHFFNEPSSIKNRKCVPKSHCRKRISGSWITRTQF